MNSEVDEETRTGELLRSGELLRTGELLRAGMERYTSDMQAPAGIVRRARRRRRRRLVLRSGAGLTAALAAGAATAVVVGMPWARHRGDGPQAITTAYVIGRAERALDTAAAGDVAQLSVSVTIALAGRTATLSATEWFYARRWRVVTSMPSGPVVSDESAAGTASDTSLTVVSPATRTWGREDPLRPPLRVGPQAVPGNCSDPAHADPFAEIAPADLAVAGALSGLTSAAVAQDLRTAASCGTLTMAGRQRIDGIDAIKLTSTVKSLAAETIWVNSRSYLPVRLVIKGADDPAARPGAGERPGRLTAGFSWLPAEPQNLAKLTAPVPAGYHRVPLTTAMRSVTDQLVRLAAAA